MAILNASNVALNAELKEKDDSKCQECGSERKT